MIKLNIEEYCNSCPNFEPDVSYTYKFGDDEAVVAHVICKYSETCKNISKYLKKQLEKEYTSHG